ncbi:MAG: hypothetical protein HY875_12785 [Chloroflexi bacterium]|nr:hypothetical protein [Chloroflexota bacterium]
MSRRLWLALGSSLLPALLLVACGGGGGAASTPPAGTSATPQATATAVLPRDTKAEPALDGPASKYGILQDDLGANFLIDFKGTFVLDAKSYGATKTFPAGTNGEALLTEWGYAGGFEASFEPEGRQTAMLNGGFYLAVESHLFKTADGASKAFKYFNGRLATVKSNQAVTTVSVGNEYAAWLTVGDKIAGSQVTAVYHRFIFRRGNLVTVVLTSGAEPFMRVDIARAVAVLIDEKATGEKPALAPTPTAKQ